MSEMQPHMAERAARSAQNTAPVGIRVMQELIHQSKQDLEDTRNRFIPRGALFRYLNQETVTVIVQPYLDLNPSNRASLQEVVQYASPSPGSCHCTSRLCTGARIILAALLSILREDLIVCFFKTSNPRICDKDLDIRLEQSTEAGIASFPKEFNNLLAADKELFFHFTWQMRSPYIERFHEIRHADGTVGAALQLQSQTTLPWTYLEPGKELADGEVTLVRRIKIDPDHHEIVSIDPSAVFVG
jgi:hypothetical protein